jgi:hypothetical protein
VIGSTSGCLHSEFMCFLFLQTHRETDRFFLSFRSSIFSIQQPVPLPPRTVLLTAQVESGQHPPGAPGVDLFFLAPDVSGSGTCV